MMELIVADVNGNAEDSRQIETLLIDLDDTLYQVHEAPELVREKIQGQLGPDISCIWFTTLLRHMPKLVWDVVQHTCRTS